MSALTLVGCGGISGVARSESMLLATSGALPPRVTSPTAVSARADHAMPPEPDPVATAVAAESNAAPSAPLTPKPAAPAAPSEFQPVAFEAIGGDWPAPLMVASSGTTTPLPAVPAREPAPAQDPAPRMVAQAPAPADDEPPLDEGPVEYDPWEPFNEKMFAFNYNFDRYLLKPVAKGYNTIMPDELQRMIGNAFDNINPVPKWVNNLLQQNYKGFFTEVGRFLINSTLGIGGLWDIARQEFGLQRTRVDFGQTLGKWGVSPGPYLVLPFLPPLTVRDGIGYGVDGAMDPLSYVLPFIWDRLGMRIGDTINDRSLNLELFQGFEETTVDLYSAVRNGYLQRRYNLIHGDE